MERKRKQLPSQKRLLELFTYNPDTGEVRRNFERGGHKAGSLCGTPKATGGFMASADGQFYVLHRLIWVYMTGEDPGGYLDHKNGDPSDNRWSNLRQCTQSQNNCNKKVQSNNRTGLKGVHRMKNGRFRSRVNLRGKYYDLGCFATAAEAKAAYDAASKVIHGDFARS